MIMRFEDSDFPEKKRQLDIHQLDNDNLIYLDFVRKKLLGELIIH